MAFDTNESKPKANAVKQKDLTIEQIGDPKNLQNYLRDLGAMQHMTPRLVDLEDAMEGRHLGVDVVDGHIIKCSATGKIHISMLDDDGNLLKVKLQDVMYVPGLSRRLFSITRFVRHGHHATFTKGTTTLKFAPSWVTIFLVNHIRATAFAADSMVVMEEQNVNQYHDVPAFRIADIPSNHNHLPSVHACLGHRKCRTLLSVNEHRSWKDVTIRMSPETGYLSCGTATCEHTCPECSKIQARAKDPSKYLAEIRTNGSGGRDAAQGPLPEWSTTGYTSYR
jgi:hypothetical protein